jgi:hypothetical protein
LQDDGEDNYQYELPSDFDDEEIDEDEAFTAEDFERYGDIGSGKKKQAVATSNDAPSDDEFSDSSMRRVGWGGVPRPDSVISVDGCRLTLVGDQYADCVRRAMCTGLKCNGMP